MVCDKERKEEEGQFNRNISGRQEEKYKYKNSSKEAENGPHGIALTLCSLEGSERRPESLVAQRKAAVCLTLTSLLVSRGSKMNSLYSNLTSANSSLTNH